MQTIHIAFKKLFKEKLISHKATKASPNYKGHYTNQNGTLKSINANPESKTAYPA